MILILALAAVLVATGTVAGVLAILAVGIHREEKACSLTVKSPGRAASGARTINGVYTRRPGVLHQASRHPQGPLVLANQETRTRWG